jgi:molybdopterin-guanine dinucleotide biosynthesis protein MobB
MTPVVFGVVGSSGVGKTTLIGRIVRHLFNGDLRVVVVKTTHHSLPRSTGDADTDRFIEAGAARAFLIAPDAVFMWDASGKHELPAESVASVVESIRDADVVIIEGGKRQGTWPRLLVHRRGTQAPDPLPPHLIAVVTDDPVFEIPRTPRLDPDDIPTIVELVSRINR